MSKVQSGDSDMLSGEGKIFVEEQRAIEYFAGQGPAISWDTVPLRRSKTGAASSKYSSAQTQKRKRSASWRTTISRNRMWRAPEALR